MHKPKPYKKKPKKKGKPRQRSGDYRIFVGAFPDGEKIDQVQQLREVIDLKTGQITPPHVTLAGTYWRTGQPTAANEAIFIEKLNGLRPYLKPFSLQLGGIYTFGQRVIYLGVLPTEEMMAIRNRLLGVMGRDKHRQFKPHLTLAMRLKGSRFSETLAELQQSEWANGRFTTPIYELRLMQRGADDPAWRTIHTLPLTQPIPTIQLRDVQDDDLLHFFAHQQEIEAVRMAAFTTKDRNDQAAFMTHWAKIRADAGITLQTILHDGKVAGHIVCHSWFGEPEISYWLGQAMWGKGIATAALSQFLTQLSVRPLFARVAQDNIGSLRVLQKCGFVITGEDKGFAHGRGEEIPEYLLTLTEEQV